MGIVVVISGLLSLLLCLFVLGTLVMTGLVLTYPRRAANSASAWFVDSIGSGVEAGADSIRQGENRIDGETDSGSMLMAGVAAGRLQNAERIPAIFSQVATDPFDALQLPADGDHLSGHGIEFFIGERGQSTGHHETGHQYPPFRSRRSRWEALLPREMSMRLARV